MMEFRIVLQIHLMFPIPSVYQIELNDLEVDCHIHGLFRDKSLIASPIESDQPRRETFERGKQNLIFAAPFSKILSAIILTRYYNKILIFDRQIGVSLNAVLQAAALADLICR